MSAAIAKSELLKFLGEQLAKAEQSVTAREHMERTSRGGTNASWREVADATGIPYLTRAKRTEMAERDKRIGNKNRREVEMFKAVIAELSNGGASNEFA